MQFCGVSKCRYLNYYQALFIGIPQPPESPVFLETGGGDLRVTVRTPASGLEPGGDFYFLLFQARASQSNPSTFVDRIRVPDYVNGQSASFTVEDLEVGVAYAFTIQAENRFGRSGNSSSNVTITGQSVI